MPDFQIVPIARIADSAVEALLDRAFGPNRHGRTAYAVRDGARPIADLSLAAIGEDGTLLGSIQCWPVQLACPTRSWPLVMVGPVAVEPEWQREGIGHRLMEAMLVRADHHADTGHDALMLIGDPEYYTRFFGFTSDRTGQWELPGPVLRHRLLARGPGVPDCAGTLMARAEAAA